MAEMGEKYRMLMNKILLFSLFFLLSCSGNSNSKMEKETTLIRDTIDSKINIQPDLSVNGLKLLDESSVRNITSKKLLAKDFIRAHPAVVFLSNDNTQYLIASQYEGDIASYFSLFEIGYLRDQPALDSVGVRIQYNNFISDSGLKLGMDLNQLIELKGKRYKEYSEHGVKVLSYTIDNPDSPLIRETGLPLYFIRVSLKNNKVFKIIFGFEYP